MPVAARVGDLLGGAGGGADREDERGGGESAEVDQPRHVITPPEVGHHVTLLSSGRVRAASATSAATSPTSAARDRGLVPHG